MSGWVAVLAVAAIGGAFWAFDHFTTPAIMRKRVNAGTDKWKERQAQGAYDSTGAETGGLDPGVGGPDGCGDGSGGDGGSE